MSESGKEAVSCTMSCYRTARGWEVDKPTG
nr:MAG TPA: hypothetical protein [Caudoviricetes sp.]